ncbi:uncharacterized protein LOC144158491 isoform X2 [Haemaphysalis longicornis]
MSVVAASSRVVSCSQKTQATVTTSARGTQCTPTLLISASSQTEEKFPDETVPEQRVELLPEGAAARQPSQRCDEMPERLSVSAAPVMERNRSINVDGAGLKCERSVASNSPSDLCGVAGWSRSRRRAKTRVPQLARKMSRCFASGVSFARKNTPTCSS